MERRRYGKSKCIAFASDTPHYEQVPFEVPDGWCWCKLENIAYVASGSTPSKEAFVTNGIPYIKMYNLRNQRIDFDFQPQYITEEVHNGKLQRSRTEIGDLIMNIVGPPLGKLAIIPHSLPQANFNQAAVLIRPLLHKEVLVNYLFYYLSEMSEINSISTKGSAGQVNISLTQSQNMRIPLPPLAEQYRIVAEIEKWFALIDIIESGKTDLQTTIKQTKSKILDLAIHGKLVPQNPNDEPASELLKRINPKAEITCDNGQYGKVLFEVPSSWKWCSLKDCCHIVGRIGFRGYTKDDLVTDGNGAITLSPSNIINGTMNYDKCTFISWHKYEESPEIQVLCGDILLVKTGSSFGKCALVEHLPKEATINPQFVVLKHISIDKQYLTYVLKSDYARNNYDNFVLGTAIPTFTQVVLGNMQIPLPPLEEQHRIVAKIEELFSSLDNIQKALEV